MTTLPAPDSSTFFSGPTPDAVFTRIPTQTGPETDPVMVTEFACIICFQLYTPQTTTTGDELFCGNDCRAADAAEQTETERSVNPL